MKKTLLMLLAVMFSVAMMADDIIITKDSQRINGKIEEVGLDAIKYRRADNPTGPLYTLQKKDIATIMYENGQVETFQETQQPAVTTVNRNQATAKSTLHAPIKYSGGLYYQGDKTMTYNEYVKFIERNCPAAFNEHKKGNTMLWTGYSLLLSGAAMVIGGTMCYIFSEESEYISGYGTIHYIDQGKWSAGVALMTIGSAAFVTSIPLYCVGAKKRTNSYETYNRECATEPDITYNITAGTNGIGLAINF